MLRGKAPRNRGCRLPSGDIRWAFWSWSCPFLHSAKYSRGLSASAWHQASGMCGAMEPGTGTACRQSWRRRVGGTLAGKKDVRTIDKSGESFRWAALAWLCPGWPDRSCHRSRAVPCPGAGADGVRTGCCVRGCSPIGSGGCAVTCGVRASTGPNRHSYPQQEGYGAVRGCRTGDLGIAGLHKRRSGCRWARCLLGSIRANTK